MAEQKIKKLRQLKNLKFYVLNADMFSSKQKKIFSWKTCEDIYGKISY